MISLNGRNRTPRTTSTLLAAALISLLALLLTAGPAFAQQPWEYPDSNGFNYRRSVDAPPRSIGCCGPTGPKMPVWKRTFDSEITGTPIVARNGGVYVGDRSGVLRGLVYSSGRTVCAQNVGDIGSGSPPSPITGSPLYVHDKNTVYVVANKPGRPRLVAVDALTCDPKWSTVLDGQANWEGSDPTYHPVHDLIYVGTCVCSGEESFRSGIGGRGSVLAIDPDTGAVLWKTYTVSPAFNGGAVAGTPVLSESPDRVFVGTDHAFVGGVADPNTDAILALDPLTGQILGSYQTRENDIGTASNRDPRRKLGFEAPLVNFNSNGRRLIGGADKGGTFYAVDPTTLELAFKTEVAPGDSQIGRVVGLAVDPSGKGTIHGVTATPTVFFGINAADGALLYAHPGTDPLHYGPPSFASNAVWSADSAGFVDIQDPTNGRILGRLLLGAPSTGGVSFSRRMAFAAIGTSNGTGGGVAAFK